MVAEEAAKRPIGRRDAYVSGGSVRAASDALGAPVALGGEA